MISIAPQSYRPVPTKDPFLLNDQCRPGLPHQEFPRDTRLRSQRPSRQLQYRSEVVHHAPQPLPTYRSTICTVLLSIRHPRAFRIPSHFSDTREQPQSIDRCHDHHKHHVDHDHHNPLYPIYPHGDPHHHVDGAVEVDVATRRRRNLRSAHRRRCLSCTGVPRATA